MDYLGFNFHQLLWWETLKKPSLALDYKADRDVTRFLWLKDPTCASLESNIHVYRFCRVPFGVISSPFLLSATITHHLQENNNQFAKLIQRDIYVDNITTGVNTYDEAKLLYTEAKSLFAAASMNLREWRGQGDKCSKFTQDTGYQLESGY